MSITVYSLNDLPDAAIRFLKAFGSQRKFAIYGEMGAGKTTFIRELCRQLQVNDIVTSPTFAIINVYTTASEEPVYHIDCYRINDIREFFDLGYEEYFYNDHYCFIEWPERIESILPDHFTRIHICITDGEKRIIY